MCVMCRGLRQTVKLQSLSALSSAVTLIPHSVLGLGRYLLFKTDTIPIRYIEYRRYDTFRFIDSALLCTLLGSGWCESWFGN